MNLEEIRARWADRSIYGDPYTYASEQGDIKWLFGEIERLRKIEKAARAVTSEWDKTRLILPSTWDGLREALESGDGKL